LLRGGSARGAIVARAAQVNAAQVNAAQVNAAQVNNDCRKSGHGVAFWNKKSARANNTAHGSSIPAAAP
jgi:hypothetical protein